MTHALLLAVAMVSQTPPVSGLEFLGEFLLKQVEENPARAARKGRIFVSSKKYPTTACSFDVRVNDEVVGRLEGNAEKPVDFVSNTDGRNTIQVDLLSAFGPRTGRSKVQWFRADAGAVIKAEISHRPDVGFGGDSLRVKLEMVDRGATEAFGPVETPSDVLDPTTVKQALGNFITVQVVREFRDVVGRASSQKIYFDGAVIGEVWNGSRVRFRVPIDPSKSKHVVKLDGDLLFSGPSRSISVAPGDEVLVTTSVEVSFTSAANAIKSLEVFPVGHAKLRLTKKDTKTPRILIVNGTRWKVDSVKEFPIPEFASLNRLIRLEIGEEGEGRERRVAFVRPGETLALGPVGGEIPTEKFSTNLPARTSIRHINDRKLPDLKGVTDSAAYVRQLRACLFHHVSDADDATGIPLVWLDDDLKAIDTQGVYPEVVELRDAYSRFLHDLDAKGAPSVSGTAASGVLAAVFQLGIEALLKQSVPTGFDVLSQAVSTGAESGFEHYKLGTEFRALNGKLKTAEDHALAKIREEFKRRPELHDRAELKEMLGTP